MADFSSLKSAQSAIKQRRAKHRCTGKSFPLSFICSALPFNVYLLTLFLSIHPLSHRTWRKPFGFPNHPSSITSRSQVSSMFYFFANSSSLSLPQCPLTTYPFTLNSSFICFFVFVAIFRFSFACFCHIFG